MATNYYETLGVQKNSTAEELKRAYRKLAMENHPDRHGGDKIREAKFKEINEAYSVLSDDTKRANYDRFGSADGPQGFGGGFEGGFDMGDIFSQFFGGGTGGRSGRRQEIGDDIEIDIRLTFAEALGGVKKTVGFSRQELCDVCHGSGAKKGSQPKKCHTCNGSGQIRQQMRTVFGIMEQTSECPTCHGQGTIISDPCDHCRGRKYVSKKTEKIVDIPAGVDDGMSMKLRGEGHRGKDGTGDIYIRFGVPESFEGLTRKETTLFYTIAITPSEAVLGNERAVKIPIIGERTVKITPGTIHGTQLKFRGDGVKHVNKDTKGDLIVTLIIEIPTKLSKKERELWEALAKEGKVKISQKGVLSSLFGDE